MTNINIDNISDLDLNGNDLFEDSESFITELSDGNEQAIIGGCVLTPIGDCVHTQGCGNTMICPAISWALS
ncbi:hypothetical protein [Pleurocapsa sp. PCC 7319]|uniref:hypothetical protein n=1 Tax=Pleurocapsa sp. PCC 7319 TaxID=118161 RepID=UPI000344A21A|nr:hypothetical protein [Pleurocapsa sp. PCC 7319]